MAKRHRVPDLVLIGGFLMILAAVPAVQVGVEMYRGVPVQCTDLLHQAPTKENLRRFEATLENDWWGQTYLRPKMQHALYQTFGIMGSKTIHGRDGWTFYRPGIRYLTDSMRPEIDDSDSMWVQPTTGQLPIDSVAMAIVHFRDQLATRDIQLLVVPVPGKASIYPDRITNRAAKSSLELGSPTEDLLDQLDAANVPTVNLFKTFCLARNKEDVTSGDPFKLYLSHDTHWTPFGVQLAAHAVAAKVRELGWASELPYTYESTQVRVKRVGDILQMAAVPGLVASMPASEVDCRQIVDPILNEPMVPTASGRIGAYMNEHLIDTPMEARILLLGDSYSRIYQTAEPSSLGQIVSIREDIPERAALDHKTETLPDTEPKMSQDTKIQRRQLLPGSAGLPSLLAAALEMPVDFLVSDGGAATGVRQQLSVFPEILDNKRYVIWEFTERDIQLGKQGWQEVPLPADRPMAISESRKCD